jgi:hypothetical protein
MASRPTAISGLYAALILGLGGCGDGVGGGRGLPDADSSGSGGGEVPGLRSITLEPADATLVIEGDTPATLAFSAIGEFDDGRQEDITSQVSFALDDSALGSFAGRALTTGTQRGGIARVTARAGGVQGGTSLTLVLRKRYADPNADLPPDPGAIFDGAEDEDEALAPTLVYPLPGVLVPPNLEHLEVHFLRPESAELFELSFQSATTDLVVYTTCTTPMGDGCIYLPDRQVWRWIAQSNRGGRVQIAARATDAEGSAVGASQSQELAFSHDDILGAIYYWTTTGGDGGGTAIVRFDFAGDQDEPEIFIAENDTGNHCVGCHALSRDGSKMFTAADGGTNGRVLLTDVRTRQPMVEFDSTPRNAFASWSPGGDQFVGVHANESSPGWQSYDLNLFDGDTGEFVETIPVGGTGATPSNHPDWSPDGDRIVFTRTGEAHNDVTLAFGRQGSIAMVERDGDGWTDRLDLTSSQAGENHYFPTFSPEGDLIAFNISTCPDGQNGSRCNAHADDNAAVYVMAPAADRAPVKLERAGAGGLLDGEEVIMNSFPKWAPFTFQRTGEFGTRLYWVSFASNRMYGLREPGGENRTLLWMAGVDPDAARSGVDPSAPAFAIPFQALDTDNHTAQWTETTLIVE